MESLTDPETLRDRADVDVQDHEFDVDARAFDDRREHWAGLDGYVAVGVTSDEGTVPLMNDGDGWTLPAGPVETGGDYAAAARRVIENTLGQTVSVDRPERVRRMAFRTDSDQFVAYSVVFRGQSVAGEPVAADPRTADAGTVDLEWVETMPDEVPEGPDEDVRLFLE